MYKAEDVPFCAPVLSPVYLLSFSFKAPIKSTRKLEGLNWKIITQKKKKDSILHFLCLSIVAGNSRIASPQIMVWRLSCEFLALSQACPLALITYLNWFPFIYVLLQDFFSLLFSLCSTFSAPYRSVCLVAGLQLSTWP